MYPASIILESSARDLHDSHCSSLCGLVRICLVETRLNTEVLTRLFAPQSMVFCSF